MMAVFFLGMTACSDDDDDKKEAVAGTYTGTITVTDEAGTPIGDPLTGQKITIVDAGKDRINLELKDFKFGTVPVGDLEIKNVAVNDKGEVNGSASQVPIMNGVLQADITVSGTVILIGGAEVHHLYFVFGTEVAPISVPLLFNFPVY